MLASRSIFECICAAGDQEVVGVKALGRAIESWLRRTALWRWIIANLRGPVYLGEGLILTRTVYGHKMIVSGLDRSFSPHLLLDAVWEPVASNLVLREVKPGMRVLDIGAHVGWHTLLMCRRVGPTGRVFAFEPSPSCFPLLVGNVQLNAYHRIAQCFSNALGDEAGSRALFEPVTKIGVWASGATLSKKTTSDWELNKGAVAFAERPVEMVRLDDLDVGRIDFAKIDTEGSEALIWQGGRNTLSNARVIMLEYAPNWMEDGPGMLREMADAGFRLEVIEENGRIWKADVETAHRWSEKQGLIYLLLRKRDGHGG